MAGRLGDLLALAVAGTWLIHGLFNKLLHGSPRHLAIVQSTPGLSGAAGERVLLAVGIFEVLMAAWVLSGWAPRPCAATQTAALLSMNVVELTYARQLLLWPAGLIPVNLLFLAAAWTASELRPRRVRLRTRLRRHPIPIDAHFRDCISLTFAAPAEALRPLLPPGLELETFRGYGYMAVALVRTELLRPVGVPKALGQDFLLIGYRVFCYFQTPDGRRLRGLRILRSDADGALIVAVGNLLTHYNYHPCRAKISEVNRRPVASVQSADGLGDLELIARTGDPELPAGSPFCSGREARRFAGPLQYTFDYEPESRGVVAIRARRAHWMPAPIAVDVNQISFFDQPMFRGCRPILAAAFHVRDVNYRWERGIWYPIAGPGLEAHRDFH
jgi:uncharacterized membrane protein YphA (DoxX/SURF4 family)